MQLQYFHNILYFYWVYVSQQHMNIWVYQPENNLQMKKYTVLILSNILFDKYLFFSKRNILRVDIVSCSMFLLNQFFIIFFTTLIVSLLHIDRNYLSQIFRLFDYIAELYKSRLNHYSIIRIVSKVKI